MLVKSLIYQSVQSLQMINGMRNLCLRLVLQTRSRVLMMTVTKDDNEDNPVKLPHLKSLYEAITYLGRICDFSPFPLIPPPSPLPPPPSPSPLSPPLHPSPLPLSLLFSPPPLFPPPSLLTVKYLDAWSSVGCFLRRVRQLFP